jgi:uncharacterized protein (DUF1800 family)
LLVAGLAASLVAGCGGGGGGGGTSGSGADGAGAQSSTANPELVNQASSSVAAVPANDAEAHRFLTQATFGATAGDIANLKTIGYEKWIDQQLDGSRLTATHLATAESAQRLLGSAQPGTAEVLYSWWTHAITDPAQLRQRVAFALSEIFVVSTIDGELGVYGQVIASYMDMLTERADGSYRDLLEAVALHPAMGDYLSHRANMREEPSIGRVPDENFAREIMQLFSIGLHELNDDGTLKLVNGSPVETYTSDDVKGLAKVFTGWSWHWPSSKAGVPWWHCFWWLDTCKDPSQLVKPMTAYPQEHSISEKRFLGVTIPATTTPNPAGDLKIALDRLASHPNTAPFVSKQLIQRLVTSNPSPEYVASVARTFRASGGNLKAVVKAILMHPEARNAPPITATGYGKLKEPVLRLTQLLRAVPHTSAAYEQTKAMNGVVPFYYVALTDDPATTLGQSPLRAPSVFNYFRPGYKPAQTQLAQADLVAPEMQITSETSVLGYANFMATILQDGWGQWNPYAFRVDIQFDLSSLEALAAQPQSLVDAAATRLLGGPAPAALNTRVVAAIGQMANASAADKRRRAQAAILMIAVSPQYTVQQ